MNNKHIQSVRKQSAGFSLVELLVAIGVFLIFSAAAVRLVQKHVPLMTTQQNQAALNIAMRNAAAQMQIDVVNAGAGFYQGANVPAWPVGLTVSNTAVAAGGNCFNAATLTYGPNCFDTLVVISTDLTTSPAHPRPNTNLADTTTCSFTTSAGANADVYLTLPGTPTAANYTSLANAYKKGNQVLLVTSDGNFLGTTVLKADANVVSGIVHLALDPTDNTTPGVYAADPLGIADAGDASGGALTNKFCQDAWVLKLAPITYAVDASNPANPKLTRKQGANAADVIAEQIIGFKVGALTFNGTTDSTYSYDPTKYNKNWSAIRSVRISMIGRTGLTENSTFRNSFDGGPYKVDAVSVVVNPRNLSMND